MIIIEKLWLFILGMVVIQWIMPLGDQVVATLQMALEMLKGKMSVRIASYNTQLRKMDEPEHTVGAIGFTANLAEEDEEEEYEE